MSEENLIKEKKHHHKDKKDKKDKKEKKEKKHHKEKKDKKEKKSKKAEKKIKEASNEIKSENDKDSMPSTESEKPLVLKKGPEFEEIEINLDEDTPLSKKEQRLLKKGKITLEQLREKKGIHAEPETKQNEEKKDDAGEEKDDENSEKPKKPEPRSKFAVWIGNLSYETTSEDIVSFIVAKTAEYPEWTPELSDDEPCIIKEKDITRVHLPKNGRKNKGFAHVDFKKPSHLVAAISLSEKDLNGRNLLIKDSHSFQGRPEKVKVLSKNPPSRILFVGNLSFDTKEELLEEHFRHCGEIVRIRMATFEDSGKCKGFAFIDFKDEEGPTKALQDKSCKWLINRQLRMEFGEDRSARKVGKRPAPENESENENKRQRFDDNNDNRESNDNNGYRERSRGFQPKQDKFQKRSNFNDYRSNEYASNKRLKSSIALATAPRASAAIVKSTGKKVKFD
ncbi:unnamed protein product [Ambrosiozyma monospora]|uniref:Unnamed protein product n=1 Tax=Ambrosiozyma monospora TaxID=43982 RepID=A0A9W6YXC8_AMBMO|nr:unnamed protein product [Ambrosiozyma monospora]